jgi:hypothetical protein
MDGFDGITTSFPEQQTLPVSIQNRIFLGCFDLRKTIILVDNRCEQGS